MTKKPILHYTNTLSLIAGLIFLIAISFEIMESKKGEFSSFFLQIQFCVCLTYLFDFFTRLWCSASRWKFLLCNFHILLLSIPFVNIDTWVHLSPNHEVSVLISIMPIARMLLALYYVSNWFVKKRINQIVTAYIFTLILSIYISSLIFYFYEATINDNLHNFGDALWWAGMNVTTVGSHIIPITTPGKILSVFLPVMGMLMFPIITAYIVQRYDKL